MKKFSVAEYEEIGKAIGAVIKDRFTGMLTQEQIEKMINERTLDLMQKSATRSAAYPFAEVLQPLDIAEIEKRLWDPASADELNLRVQEWNDDLYCLTSILKVAPQQLRTFPVFQKRWSELAKALNTQTTGTGLDWIPTGFSNRMIEFIEIEAVVASKFPTITMPTNPYQYPILLADGTAYVAGEATTDSPSMFQASNISTNNLTFTAQKLVTNYSVTDEMTEDSITPVLPQLRKSIARTLAKAEDNAIINGDTTSTHFDTGYTVADNDARVMYKGLRRLCSDANAVMALKVDASTWSTSAGLALLRGAVEDMGVYGITASDLKIFCNTNMRGKLRALDEVSTNDKFGSAATIHGGELSGIDGIDIVLTQHVEEAQNDSGVYDATTVTDTQLLIVYTPGFWRGIRKAVKLDYVAKPLNGISYLVAQTRRVWKPVYETATQGTVAWLYNIAK